jgi:serine/threonine protein kinase
VVAGWASVYKAEDTKLHRFVALKFLSGEFAPDSQALGRFDREAQAAPRERGKLQCAIHVVGDTSSLPAFLSQILSIRI